MFIKAPHTDGTAQHTRQKLIVQLDAKLPCCLRGSGITSGDTVSYFYCISIKILMGQVSITSWPRRYDACSPERKEIFRRCRLHILKRIKESTAVSVAHRHLRAILHDTARR